MAFLLNPNLAYILIVAAFLMTVFAILIPGTGVFEIVGLVAWGVVLWQTYNIDSNLWALILLLLGFVPFGLSLRGKRVKLYLGLMVTAFVIGSAYLFKGDSWWQPGVHPLLALVMSLFAGGVVWLVAAKLIEAMGAPSVHDLGTLIGAVGEAKTKIHTEGSVYVGGEKWTARSDQPIKIGERVEVVARDGLVLIVKQIK
ncbi:MAG: NfeD family protein [Chloroflexota bacterium]